MNSCRQLTMSLLLVACALCSRNGLAQELTYGYDSAGNLTSIQRGSGSAPASTCPDGTTCGTVVKLPPPTKLTPFCASAHCASPEQPMLLSGGLHGQRVCGDFYALASTFSFNCDPLPSNEDSGWQLTPLFWVNAAGRSLPNKGVVLNVSTPTRTELFIDLENEAGGHTEQSQVSRNPGDAEVMDLGPHGQVAVLMSEDRKSVV